ncbi:MAG TPA: hypothetical protein VH370_27775 [Humisphaera sp.]|jgi:hypothetical protein|nr:hypothetical protein [Humisphaera sp.]
MPSKSLVGTLTIATVGTFVTALFFTSPARSAEPKPVAEVPEGYVLVKQDALRQLVHDEVARQLQDFYAQVRREKEQQQAAGRMASLLNTTMILRSQIALYGLQHRDQVPTVGQMGDGFKFLTLQTDAAGNPASGLHAVGPYLQHPSINAVTGKSKVAAIGKATAEDGWSYDPKSEMVKAVLPRSLETQLKDRINPRDVEFVDAGN